MEAFLYNSPSRLYVCRVAYSLCLSMKDMSMVLQHSWAPCSAAWRQLAVQSGSAGHHSPPKMRVQGFRIQSKPYPLIFFTNQRALNQTERKNTAGVEFGWNFKKPAYLPGRSTGHHRLRGDMAAHPTDPSPIHVQRMRWMLNADTLK